MKNEKLNTQIKKKKKKKKGKKEKRKKGKKEKRKPFHRDSAGCPDFLIQEYSGSKGQHIVLCFFCCLDLC
jgi:phage terminase small subunit